jgi:two-component system, OmpR family, phosphate regulon sensor histidine kinase PhoR
MSTRNVFFLAGSAMVLGVLLLLHSYTVRSFVAYLLFFTATILIVRSFLTRHAGDRAAPDSGTPHRPDEERSPQTFALGELFEATMTGMREGLLVVDKDMRVVASNFAAHKLFSTANGQLNNQRLTELTRNPEIYSAFLDALQGTERSGVKIQTHTPERRVFDLRVVPLISANGEEGQGALGVFIDVTQLERLEQVRQEFLSNVSHELRTPLTSILALVETLEAGAIDDKEATERFLPIIRRNAGRMNELIDDILELSAIEAGNVQVKAEEVELRPVVDDVVASLAAKAESRDVAVENAIPRSATAFADRRRLEQMLTNLIENAIKFNREGGSVVISFRGPSTANDWRSEIIVKDTGEGIPAQHLERLFERFYRVDRARSREMGGTGLGLAIVKHLARLHGGEVTVTSELGKGTRFTIELPANAHPID